MVFVLVHPCRSTTAQGECGQEQSQELEERMVFVAIILKRRRSNTPHCNRESVRAGSGSSCFGSSVTTCHGRVAGFRNDCREARSIRFLLDWIWPAAGSGDSSSLFGRTRTSFPPPRHGPKDAAATALPAITTSRRPTRTRRQQLGSWPEEARTGGGGPLVGPARGACTSTVQP